MNSKFLTSVLLHSLCNLFSIVVHDFLCPHPLVSLLVILKCQNIFTSGLTYLWKYILGFFFFKLKNVSNLDYICHQTDSRNFSEPQCYFTHSIYTRSVFKSQNILEGNNNFILKFSFFKSFDSCYHNLTCFI